MSDSQGCRVRHRIRAGSFLRVTALCLAPFVAGFSSASAQTGAGALSLPSDLGPDFLLAPRTTPISIPFFPLTRAWSSRAAVVTLVGRNAGPFPLASAGARLGRVSSGVGDAAKEAGLRSGLAIRDDGCRKVLAPRTDCSVEIVTPSTLEPGRYEVEVAVEGSGSGQSLRLLALDVRASPWLAGLLVALGAVLGVFVVRWREEGRPIVRQLIDSADMRDALGRLGRDPAIPGVGAAAAALAAELRDLDGRIGQGGDHAVELSHFHTRGAALARANAAMKAVTGAGPDAQTLLAAAVEAVAAVLRNADWTADALNGASASLESEFAGFGALARATGRAGRALAAVAALQPLAPATAAAAAAVDTVERLSREVRLPVPGTATGGEALGRAGALDAATGALESAGAAMVAPAMAALAAQVRDGLAKAPTDRALLSLSDEIGKAGPAPGLETAAALALRAPAPLRDATEGIAPVEDAASITIPPLVMPAGSGFALQPDWTILTAVSSARGLRAVGMISNLLANLAVLAAIGATGVVVLWSGNPVWGSPVDVVTALLAGAGARMAAGALPGLAAR